MIARPSKLVRPAAAFTKSELSLELERRLRREAQGQVLLDLASRGRYATDASIYQIMPVAVFVPARLEDVRIAIDIARDLSIPVLPRGAGTSQCGQTVGAALIIDYSKYIRALVEFDPASRTATVQPGLVLDHLNAQLKPYGLWFPVDVSTSAQATLGGMAGNNSCGSRSLAYGNMVHNVLGISAWLSDGSLVQFGPIAQAVGRARGIADVIRGLADRHQRSIEANWPKVLRRVGGYNLDIFHNQSSHPYTADGGVNLAHLLVGSEGTLACTHSLQLRLATLPRARALGVVNFPTFRASMDAAQHIVRLRPTAVELIDRTMIELSLINPAFRAVVERALIGEPAAILLVEFCADDGAQLPPKLAELATLMGALGLPDSVVELSDAQARQLWEVRKAGLNIMMSLRGDGKPVSFIEDCAVPLEHLAEYTDALTEVFARYGTRGTWYAHASVGTLHVRPILDMRRDGAAKMRAIAEEASELVRKFRGAYSGEHGDGLCRGEWIEWQFGPALNDAFRAIKDELDPIGLFNPGKIVDPPKMDDASLFRYPPQSAARPYRVQPLRPLLDWSAWNVQNDPLTEGLSAAGSGGDVAGGFAKAAEMCNNNGHCRKFDAGTMCPSYRVTRDEQHSTRGRANTLRLALSGQLESQALSGRALYDTMDLCVGCKGCKRECPTGVDMARMKTEFLAHYKARHGYTIRDRLTSRLPDYAHLASRAPGLLNLRDKLPGAAWLSEKLLGFSSRRPLPRWRSDAFWRRPTAPLFASAEQTMEVASRGGKAAVLFVDTFNGVFEPENALAAAQVLTTAGYTLHTPFKRAGHFCCGRTYLSSGMVEMARAKTKELLEVLLPFARAGAAIVGLEPACLLTLRDEALVLGLGDAADTVAATAMLLEEFIAAESDRGRFEARFNSIASPILVHAHCHQKAFEGVASMLDVLRLIPGADPKLIDGSCCGMAGAFGYEAQHYDISMRMAELTLLPAIRQSPDAIVVADGISCRHQIQDGSKRHALHAAQLLRRQLAT